MPTYHNIRSAARVVLYEDGATRPETTGILYISLSPFCDRASCVLAQTCSLDLPVRSA